MLQELNKESLLLLYLADELPARDRAEVDAMLAANPGLRDELEHLNAAVQSFEEGMARLDALPIASEAMIARRIGQAMRQRMTEQLIAATPPAKAVEPRLRYPWWAYPSVAAAVVLITFVSWWGQRPDAPMRIQPDKPGLAYKPTARPAGPSLPEDPNAQAVAALDATADQVAELSRSRNDFSFSDDH